ncbi:MAG: 50S ribosome-binding GTPase [archaeon]|nr:50S ribosome-binding GTPase [archaeon]
MFLSFLSTAVVAAVGIFGFKYMDDFVSYFKDNRANNELKTLIENRYEEFNISIYNYFGDPSSKFCRDELSLTYKAFNYEEKIFEKVSKEEMNNLVSWDITDNFDQVAKRLSKKSINHLNILLLGGSGVGKSHLTNKVLSLTKAERAEEDLIRPTTQGFNEYTSDKRPNLRIIDTKGIEKAGYNINEMVEEVHQFIDKREKEGDPDKFIHCIWFCVTGTRMEKIEEETIQKLSDIYINSSLPIIVVYTQAIIPNFYNAFKKHIHKHYPKLKFIPVLADDMPINNGEVVKAFNLDKLVKESINKARDAIYSSLFTYLNKKIKEMAKKKLKNSIEQLSSNNGEKYSEKIKNLYVKVMKLRKNKTVEKIIKYFEDIENKSHEKVVDICIEKIIKEKLLVLTDALMKVQRKIYKEYPKFSKPQKTNKEFYEEAEENYKETIKNLAIERGYKTEESIITSILENIYEEICDGILKAFDSKKTLPEIENKIREIIQKKFKNLAKDISKFQIRDEL